MGQTGALILLFFFSTTSITLTSSNYTSYKENDVLVASTDFIPSNNISYPLHNSSAEGFQPPSDIVHGFKPVYSTDAQFVSITTDQPPPPRRRKPIFQMFKAKSRPAKSPHHPHLPTPLPQQQAGSQAAGSSQQGGSQQSPPPSSQSTSGEQQSSESQPEGIQYVPPPQQQLLRQGPFKPPHQQSQNPFTRFANLFRTRPQQQQQLRPGNQPGPYSPPPPFQPMPAQPGGPPQPQFSSPPQQPQQPPLQQQPQQSIQYPYYAPNAQYPFPQQQRPQPNQQLLSLNLNNYLKRISTMFSSAPYRPQNGGPLRPQPQQLQSQQQQQQPMYPHYYPLNTFAPSSSPKPQQVSRRRRIKVRKNQNRRAGEETTFLAAKPRNSKPEEISRDDDKPDSIQVKLTTAFKTESSSRGFLTSDVARRTFNSVQPVFLRMKRSSTGYRMPGLFGMDGNPFYLDKDPKTGDIISYSNKKSPSSSNEVNDNSTETSTGLKKKKPMPIIIHSYSTTKLQGHNRRPLINQKLHNKRPTFYKANRTTTLAPPRLPSFYPKFSQQDYMNKQTSTEPSTTTTESTTVFTTTTPPPPPPTPNTTPSTTTTLQPETPPTQSTSTFDPYLPIELLNFQRTSSVTPPTSTLETVSTTPVPTSPPTPAPPSPSLPSPPSAPLQPFFLPGSVQNIPAQGQFQPVEHFSAEHAINVPANLPNPPLPPHVLGVQPNASLLTTEQPLSPEDAATEYLEYSYEDVQQFPPAPNGQQQPQQPQQQPFFPPYYGHHPQHAPPNSFGNSYNPYNPYFNNYQNYYPQNGQGQAVPNQYYPQQPPSQYPPQNNMYSPAGQPPNAQYPQLPNRPGAPQPPPGVNLQQHNMGPQQSPAAPQPPPGINVQQHNMGPPFNYPPPQGPYPQAPGINGSQQANSFSPSMPLPSETRPELVAEPSIKTENLPESSPPPLTSSPPLLLETTSEPVPKEEEAKAPQTEPLTTTTLKVAATTTTTTTTTEEPVLESEEISVEEPVEPVGPPMVPVQLPPNAMRQPPPHFRPHGPPPPNFRPPPPHHFNNYRPRVPPPPPPFFNQRPNGAFPFRPPPPMSELLKTTTASPSSTLPPPPPTTTSLPLPVSQEPVPPQIPSVDYAWQEYEEPLNSKEGVSVTMTPEAVPVSSEPSTTSTTAPPPTTTTSTSTTTTTTTTPETTTTQPPTTTTTTTTMTTTLKPVETTPKAALADEYLPGEGDYYEENYPDTYPENEAFEVPAVETPVESQQKGSKEQSKPEVVNTKLPDQPDSYYEPSEIVEKHQPAPSSPPPTENKPSSPLPNILPQFRPNAHVNPEDRLPLYGEKEQKPPVATSEPEKNVPNGPVKIPPMEEYEYVEEDVDEEQITGMMPPPPPQQPIQQSPQQKPPPPARPSLFNNLANLFWNSKPTQQQVHSFNNSMPIPPGFYGPPPPGLLPNHNGTMGHFPPGPPPPYGHQGPMQIPPPGYHPHGMNGQPIAIPIPAGQMPPPGAIPHPGHIPHPQDNRPGQLLRNPPPPPPHGLPKISPSAIPLQEAPPSQPSTGQTQPNPNMPHIHLPGHEYQGHFPAVAEPNNNLIRRNGIHIPPPSFRPIPNGPGTVPFTAPGASPSAPTAEVKEQSVDPSEAPVVPSQAPIPSSTTTEAEDEQREKAAIQNNRSSSSEEIIYVTQEELEKIRAEGHEDEFVVYSEEQEDSSLGRSGQPVAPVKQKQSAQPSPPEAPAQQQAPPSPLPSVPQPQRLEPLNPTSQPQLQQVQQQQQLQQLQIQQQEQHQHQFNVYQQQQQAAQMTNLQKVLTSEHPSRKDYDTSVELITGNPIDFVDDGKPRDIVVKSSFSHSGGGPQPPSPPVPMRTGSSMSQPQSPNGWRSAVEAVPLDDGIKFVIPKELKKKPSMDYGGFHPINH